MVFLDEVEITQWSHVEEYPDRDSTGAITDKTYEVAEVEVRLVFMGGNVRAEVAKYARSFGDRRVAGSPKRLFSLCDKTQHRKIENGTRVAFG
jgi:hypothetical protein